MVQEPKKAPVCVERWTSQDAKEVHAKALRTLELVAAWVDRGASSSTEPVTRYTDSQHLRSTKQKSGELLKFALKEEGINESGDDGKLWEFLEATLNDSVNPWTRRFLDKLYQTPSTMGPAIELMLGALNASGVVSSASPALSLAEEQSVEALARQMSWDPNRCDGLTMPGGSASNILAVQTALANAFPSFKSAGILGVAADLQAQGRKGRAARPILVTSAHSHYSMEKAALGCGLGLDSVVKVKGDATGRIDVEELDSVLEMALSNLDGESGTVAGYPFFVGSTSGTTILGAFDDLDAINKICNCHRQTNGTRIWHHVDASWGGPVLFSRDAKRLMCGVENVDSLTINPHKALNVTQQCSFALFRDGSTLAANVTGAKYLFHGTGQGPPNRDVLRRNPGSKTMGCGRRPDAFKFYVAWLQEGSNGFGAHVDRGIAIARKVVDAVKKRPTLQLAQGMPSESDLFLNVCFQPALGPAADIVIAQTLSKLAAEGNTTVESLRKRLCSQATVHAHSELGRAGKFTVDRAPLLPPHGEGYYMRLITHPTTPWHIYEEIIDEIDRLGQQMLRAQYLEGLCSDDGVGLSMLLSVADD